MPDPRKFLYEITKINISDIQVQADEVATDSDENQVEIVWFTFGISECAVLIVAFVLKQASEKIGVEFR